MHMVNAASNINEIERELSKIHSKFFVANDVFCGKKMREALKAHGIEKIVATSLSDGIPMGLNGDKLKYDLITKLKGVNKKEYNGKDLISFEQLLNIGRNSQREVVACNFVPNKMVTVAYTSGSMGNSKACVASWEKIDAMIQIMGMTELGRFADDDVMFTTFPLWIYYSLLNMIHEPLSLGVTLALDPLFDPKNLAKRNEQYKFNHWLTIPPYVKAMTERNKPMDCSRWKIVVTGGAELECNVKFDSDAYIKENGGTAEVEQGYGATEVLGSFSYGYYDNPTVGSVGKPCIGNIIKILDPETNEPLGINETGVGYLYTAARMDEYYGDEEATAYNLVTDENGVTWYNTEDLLHVNERGEIFLDGRIRRMALTLDAKKNPTKIIPERTKKCISEMPEVSKCEVITVPDKDVVSTAVAFVVTKNGKEDKQLEQSIIEKCRKNIPEYMVPSKVYFVPTIPETPNKKSDLKVLEKMYQEINSNTNIKTKSKRMLSIRR